MKSPIVLLLSLLDDFSRLEPGVQGLKRDLQTLKRRYKHEGYGLFAVTLPSIGKALDQGLASGRFTCPYGFAKAKGSAIPRLFSGMLSEVFVPVTGCLKETPNQGVITNLRQICYLFKKVTLTDESDVYLDLKAKRSFLATDEIAASLVLEDRVAHMLRLVSKYVLPDLDSQESELATYKHGPGAVVEGLSSNQKWSELFNAIENDSFDILSYGLNDFFAIARESEVLEEKVLDLSKGSTLEDMASRSCARLISVPKNSTSRRTITVEPLVKQYCQQGLNILLRDSIARCKILSNSLALTDQTVNQKLALEGSLLDNWATIDLSSASDRLSLTVVEAIFGAKETFHGLMMDSRSTHVQCDLFTAELSKFAGMGNALTFPVQSVCFTVIGIAAILDKAGRKPTYRNVLGASRHIRCYGDDIIVTSEYAHQVVIWLERCGLKVNNDKSFLTGKFKESCGVDAYNGVEVTPLYLRHRPDQPSTEPSALQSLVEFSNHMWLKCYYKAADCIRREVEDRLGETLPLVSSRTAVLGWHTRLDAMEPHKWNRRLHRLETRAYALKPLKRRDRLDGFAALLKFFHVPLLGRGRGHLEKTAIRYKTLIRRTWVPTET
ncbi:RNA-directed RNA polymerase [ssRNA phage Gephyllon.1_24]|uniref:RNA-directed RNA polymerase n=2 Tax=Leviviricetes TaxID=2842243 RepID=A0A8S5L015_9VIRU|nr:RNA-directed RNA polymerase [ssRNA phage Gephyllon.1_24]QDH90078.1 MAG: RNA-dependent RNA polymerase [Leviviridae sp.]DAD50450.1 TPA_asm: RNA-directed RNA polymerase [ssRNA phage Gephyllon.1_24]